MHLLLCPQVICELSYSLELCIHLILLLVFDGYIYMLIFYIYYMYHALSLYSFHLHLVDIFGSQVIFSCNQYCDKALILHNWYHHCIMQHKLRFILHFGLALLGLSLGCNFALEFYLLFNWCLRFLFIYLPFVSQFCFTKFLLLMGVHHLWTGSWLSSLVLDTSVGFNILYVGSTLGFPAPQGVFIHYNFCLFHKWYALNPSIIIPYIIHHCVLFVVLRIRLMHHMCFFILS